MRKMFFALFAGLLAGILVTLAATWLGLVNLGGAGSLVVRDIVDGPAMQDGEVIRHRANHFVELDTIEALQALPREFDRAEALYALSGRSNSLELQTLAFDAVRIADPVWRERALSIVFFRLTEADPNSALALVHTDYFVGMRNIEARVWRTWARMNLAGAIDAARVLDDRRFGNAVQMIYGAVGGAYTEEARLVEEELGVRPDTSNRRRYFYDLVADSKDKALAHVLALTSSEDRAEQTKWLADLMSFDNVDTAEQFAERIDDEDLRRRYLDVVYEKMARDYPLEAFEKQLANRTDSKIDSKDIRRLRAIAKDDLKAALRILGNATDETSRRSIALAIAAQYAAQEPAQALEWVQSQPAADRKQLLKAVIGSVASIDAELALEAAQQQKNQVQRNQLIRSVVKTVAKQSPRDAANLLEGIEQKSDRIVAASAIAKDWLKKDTSAAIDWLLNTDAEVSDAIFKDRFAAKQIQLDEAQAIVAALPEKYRATWARAVADRLTKERSAQDALRFVSQFEGQRDYPMQMAHLVTKVAANDPNQAIRWADRIPAGNSRDAALSNIVASHASKEPDQAAEWLTKINDPDLRQVAASDLVRKWYREDAVGARQWIDAMPRGADRDNVIVNTVVGMAHQGNDQSTLIDSIDNPRKREQAIWMQDLWQSRDDPDALIRKLDTMEMPDLFRQQMKAQILRSAARGN